MTEIGGVFFLILFFLLRCNGFLKRPEKVTFGRDLKGGTTPTGVWKSRGRGGVGVGRAKHWAVCHSVRQSECEFVLGHFLAV